MVVQGFARAIAGAFKRAVEAGPGQAHQTAGVLCGTLVEVEEVQGEALALGEAGDGLVNGVKRFVAHHLAVDLTHVNRLVKRVAAESQAVASARASPLPADVAGDGVEPAPESVRLTQPVEVAVGPEERFLGQVLGGMKLARRVVADGADQPGIAVVELREGGQVTTLGGGDEAGFILR